MKTKLLLLILVSSLLQVQGQFLAPYYQNERVTLKNVQSGMHMESNPALYGTDAYQNYSNVANQYLNQAVIVENGVTNDFYRLRHVASGKYITVIVSPGYAEMRNLGDCPNTDYQEFKFIKQPTAYWYKLQAHFSHNGINEVLCIDDGAGFDNGGIRLQPNKTIGNDSYQRWYLTNLAPPANPSDAIPTLEDRFEDRTVGLTDNLRGFAWRGVPEGNSASSIYVNTNYADFAAQFKLEYTDEVGWYRIRHKASNKWVSIDGAYDGRPVILRNVYDITGETQKFKFIWKANGKYEIHSKFTQGPEVGNNASLLLQVHPSNADVQLYLGVDNTAGATSDGWQLFDLVSYVNPALPAEFDGGASMLSGKLTGKQYHITARETLAMLEPYVIGNDTFVRVQQSPVYGEQSEWVLDAGRPFNTAGQISYRIRYGKTGQYIYLPSPTENAAAAGLRLQLKSATGTEDKRFEFMIQQNVPGPNWCVLASMVNEGLVHTDDDGFVETASGINPNNTYVQDRHFCFNLSIPINQTSHLYIIATKRKGHYLTDNGVKGNLVPAIHARYADFSSTWQIIPTNDNYCYIKNQLTQQYLTCNNDQSLGAQVYTSTNNNTTDTRWVIERQGNFYNLKNVYSGRYLGTVNDGDDGGNVNQSGPGSSGSDWIISRADYPYFADPELEGVYSPGLLDDYAVNPINSFTDSVYKDEMMRNLGLPFEPSLQVFLHGARGYDLLQQEGFATDGSAPSFIPVIKSALVYAFNYSGSRADSAIRNYKLDTAGHRVDVTYALKKYIIEDLAIRDANTWTASETALVSWLERRIKSIRVNYADRLEASWENFKVMAQLSNTDLPFTKLLAGPLDITLFEDVDYYEPNPNTQASVSEYSVINRSRDYKNPGVIAALTFPAVANAGLLLLFAHIPRMIAAAEVGAVQAKVAADIAAWEFSERAANGAVKAATQTASTTSRATAKLMSVGAVSFIASVAVIAMEILVSRALEVDAYIDFENDLYEKINVNRNGTISIKNLTLSPGLLDQIALVQDMDHIFATGERFDNINGVVSYEFTGDGNWSNPTNWRNGFMPPNPLPANNEIIINPVSNGSCILDIPYSLTAENINSRIKVKPFKNFVLAATLTVPSAKVVK